MRVRGDFLDQGLHGPKLIRDILRETPTAGLPQLSQKTG
jgi:hypothetical protein